MLEFGGIRSTPLLPSLPGPLRPKVVAPDRVLSMGQTEINCVLMLNVKIKVNCLKYNSFDI